LNVWVIVGKEIAFSFSSFASSCSSVETCQAGMFLCTFEVTCIAEDLRCNGIPDCIGSEDEQSCEGRYMELS